MKKGNIYSELEYFRKEVRCMSIKSTIQQTNMLIEEYLKCVYGDQELTLEEAFQISNNLNVPLEILFPKVFK